MDIIWHKNDLRLTDNQIVNESKNGIPLYIFDSKLLKYSSNRRLKWIIENIKSLRSKYRQKGSDLAVRIGKSPQVIDEIMEKYTVDRILTSKSYTKLGRSRDRKVRDRAENKDTEYISFYNDVMHEPDSIFTNKGTPYSVFTYYYKKWKNRDKETPYEAPEEFYEFDDPISIPRLDDLDFNSISIELPSSGTESARDALKLFLNEKVENYEDYRDYPNKSSTSRLSPYLSYGIIGIREVWEETQSIKESLDEEDISSINEFQEQLAWRDFYHQVIYHNPNLVYENYKDYENEIAWVNDDNKLQKWKQGRTGYPIVDAGMRQLKREGWMHNRVRMIVASFLTKDLLIDWRKGYDWFRDMLIDHNTANNNGGWQWAASTGTDAQPYFRIFNPMTQGEDYDPDAEYIKKYVKELKGVDPQNIHNWTELSDSERQNVAPNYYEPIVDHSEQREKALNVFKSARGDK